jgi:membrane-bound ClpP family serine protease
MTRKSLAAMVVLALTGFVLPLNADTFKNKKTGEIFYGFRTQKSSANQTLVYNDSTKKLTPLDLRDYEVTMDGKGRRNSVVMVSITDAEVLLSKTVAEIVSEAIVKASNTGPQFVLLKIDNPGGRGEYMKSLCTTITKTDNCKVVAYISGGGFGGAYSAAAILALACDKIYIAPTASISTIGPFVDGYGVDFVKSYSSDNLASFSIFAATLAEQHQRPALLAKSLLDKKISIVEVTDSDGKTSLIEKNLRQPTQTIVKTICEGFSEPIEKPVASNDKKESNPAIPADIHSRVLNLTAGEAVRLKLADRIVYSIQEILAEMNVSDAQIANAPGIDTAVKQFAAARKNIQQRLARIEFLENRAATLEVQLDKLEDQIRTTPATRTQTKDRNGPYRNRRGNVVLGGGSTGYSGTEIDATNYDQVNNMPLDTTNNSNGYNMVRRNSGQPLNRSESVTTSEPSVSSQQAKVELSYVLSDLIAEYRQTINSAKRWVGSLPAEIQLQTLEKNMNSAMALSENLQFRS